MIFVSHSGEDKPIARRLLESLARHGLAVWLDEQQLNTGANLNAMLLRAISDCNLFVYLASGSANKSKWVQRELNHAHGLEVDGKLRIVPVRLLGDESELPKLLDDRAYSTLDIAGGGVARLAHELKVLARDARPVGADVRGAATVRLSSGGLFHTLDEVTMLVGGSSTNVLFMDDQYSRLDEMYWNLAELRIPSLRGASQQMEYANRAVDSVHDRCRRIIGEVGKLAENYLSIEAVSRYVLFKRRGLLRGLHVLLHTLQWNVRYLTALRDSIELAPEFTNAKYLPDAFDGHLCQFMSHKVNLGTTMVPKHGHPWPDCSPLMPWGLTNPFGDLLEDEAGIAVATLVARRFLAGTLSSAALPDPASLLYGLG